MIETVVFLIISKKKRRKAYYNNALNFVLYEYIAIV